MAFVRSTVGYFGEGGLGELNVTANKSDLNAYAQVVSISGKTLTFGNISDASKFTVGTLLFIHVAGYAGTGTFKYLGNWRVSKITAVSGNTVTVVKTLTNLAGGDSNALIQAVTLPEYSTVTLTKSLTCPQFNQTTGYGGVVALMCSEELIFNGGHINLSGKGLPSASLRPEFNFETYPEESYNGFENYNLRSRMPLNYPDGAAFILAKKITCNENSRIGNPSKTGEARRPVLEEAEKGGANILIAADEIEDFNVAMISKMPSVTSGGKGKSGCYIATETCIPCDEGTYAYDRMTTPTRLSSTLKVKDFGDGSSGTKTNYVKQLNSYAAITSIDKTRKVFTIANPDNNGLAKITKGALVMIHTDRKSGGQYQHVGRFSLARILSYELNKVTVDTPLDSLENWTTSHFAFQMIAIPQFKDFTLAKENSATPEYKNGRGGLVAIAVNDTCDLSGGKLLVEGKGGESIYTSEKGLNFISNAQAAEKLPIGEGNGSVFILANNLVMNSETRLGASWTGKNFGGGAIGAASFHSWSKYYATNITNMNGNGERGGVYKNSSIGYDLAGGYNSNSKWSAFEDTRNGGYQGANVLIVANKITALNLAALSTGGQGGRKWQYTTGKGKPYAGGDGGCGFGGAGGYFAYSTKASTVSGGNGGYIGGGSGFYDANVQLSGGGSGGFCFVYCNEFENQDTDYLSPD